MKFTSPLDDRINIILNILRIGGYDRTVVVVVGIFKLIALIRNTWIENVFDIPG